MAVPQNTLIGRTRKSVGGVTFYTSKRLNVIQSKKISGIEAPALKDSQLITQALSSIWLAISNVLMYSFQVYKPSVSAYNSFLRANKKSGAFTVVNGVVIFHPEHFIAALGTLLPSDVYEIDWTVNEGVLDIYFTGNVNGNLSDNDVVAIVLYNGTTNEFTASISTYTRNGYYAEFITPSNPPYAGTIAAWYFFISANRKLVQNSVYVPLQ